MKDQSNIKEIIMPQEKFFYCIKMSEQTLKFGDIVVNKQEFHASKQAIALNLVNTNKILVAGFKYFIGYLHDDDVIRP